MQFCIDQLLTAEEVVTRLVDAVHFLKAWSDVYLHEAREFLRTPNPEGSDPNFNLWDVRGGVRNDSPVSQCITVSKGHVAFEQPGHNSCRAG